MGDSLQGFGTSLDATLQLKQSLQRLLGTTESILMFLLESV